MHDTHPPAIEPVVISDPDLDVDRIDYDAIKVVRRLQRFDHETYLVGGCVRDLLLDTTPKDFDVATAATPRQVKKLFNNSRLIGRRFRLAHIYFKGNNIIEVASFRSQDPAVRSKRSADVPVSGGTAGTDASLRDFTVNALFYDPMDETVIDYVGGMDDIEERRLRTIGDPEQRFDEDPVRILRGVKSAAKLDLEIESDTCAAMVRCREGLKTCSKRRLFEEVLKLLNSGVSHTAFQILRATGILPIFLPFFGTKDGRTAVGENVDGILWSFLTALDELPEHRRTVPVMLSCLFLPVLYANENGAPGQQRLKGDRVEDLIHPFTVEHSVSRKDRAIAREICWAQHHFHKGPHKRGKRHRILRRNWFKDALTLFRLSCRVANLDEDRAETWVDAYKTYRRQT